MSIFPSENESPVTASKKAKHNICARTTSPSSSSSCWSASPPWSSPTKSPGRDETHVAVPFSWEDEPGVPKQLIISPLPRKPTNNSHSKICQQQLLRPPPLLSSKSLDWRRHRNEQQQHTNYSKKKGGRSKDDPFVAALVKCTKHGDRQGKDEFINKSEHDHKHGFSSNIFSCLSKACSVRESQVILPRLTLSEKKLGRPLEPHDHRKIISSKQCKDVDVHDPPKETEELFYHAVPSSKIRF